MLMRLDRNGGRCVLVTGLSLLALCVSEAAGLASGQTEPVAIIAFLSGTALVTPPSAPKRPLELFDRLAAGATLEIEPQSSVVVAFAKGDRFELGGGARATVGRDGLTRTRGSVRPLAPVSPLPRIPALREAEGGRTAAVRIRGGLVGGLYPHAGTAVIPDEAVLSYSAPAEAGECTVEVQDRAGNAVFKTETPSPQVAVPPHVLVPGESYSWGVRCPAATGATLRAQAAFVALRQDQWEARAALKAAVAGLDSTALALLGEIDRSLGLLREAREELRAASAQDPGNAALRAALAQLERQMENPER